MFANRFFPSATSPPTPGLPNNPLASKMLIRMGSIAFRDLQGPCLPPLFSIPPEAATHPVHCRLIGFLFPHPMFKIVSLFRAFGHSVSPLWRIPTQSRIKLNLCLVNSTNSLTSQWGKYHCPGFRRQKPKVAQQLANWSGRQHGAVSIWIWFSLIPSFLFL